MPRKTIFLVGLVAALLVALLVGCTGPAGTSEGTISGTVTDSLAGRPVSEVTVTIDPAIEGVSITTDVSGNYTATLPIGAYTLTFEKDNYEASTEAVGIVAGQTVTKDAVLEPTSAVLLDAGEDQESSPGETVTLKATVEPLDSSQVTGYEWTQTAGVAATIENANSDTATVTLGDATAYRNQLFEALETVDRFVVQGINPHSLEEAEEATFKVTVTTSSGSYSDTVNVMTHLPYATISLGINNVPVDVPVLLHGKDQDAYGWSLSAPDGSSAALDDPSVQNPGFTPDVAGKYMLTEANSGATFDVYAGTWMGVITGKDENGEPIADSVCTTCHNNSTAPDKFAAWKASGHAEILSSNIDNPAGHWGIGCASCHTVGYDPDADNNGFDEVMAKEGWEAPEHGDPENWAAMLADYPGTARLANIQCENCHGPQDSAAHTQASARTSLSSDVCGACHGEPARHARFQQWEESNHADYTLAIERGTNASCGRCHAAQGFLAWLPQLEAGDPDNIKADITWTADDAHPVTCIVCHDPHAQGKTSGEPNTATVRIEDNTPMLPAGFAATAVGRGAICMTCHNTRNGAHNDVATEKADDRAPHTAAQTDVLMGQNAYFVEVGKRGAHSLINDTCTNCHLELTPPPEDLSYNLAGTNHTFEASLETCSQCHGVFDGGALPESVEDQLHELEAAIEDAIKKEITAQTGEGNTVTLVKMGEGEADVDITADSSVTAIQFTESHGRLAMDITVGGKKYEHVRLASDTMVKGADGNELGTLLDSDAGQAIAKAGWNFFLIEGDGSEGIHNPSFTFDVLEASIDALK